MPGGEQADVFRMEAVDVFHWADGTDDGGVVYVLWQWQLHEDAGDGRVSIEMIDEIEKLLLSRGGGKPV